MTARRSSSASLNALPDHPIRRSGLYQFFVRGGRPTLMWVGVVAAAWSLCVGEWFHMPMPNEKVMIVLSFVATIYGLRSIEKTKGVA